MRFGVIKTNGGVHPADKLAVATADQIMSAVFGDNRSSGAALRFESTIVTILEAGHGKVQEDERGALVRHGLDRLVAVFDPGDQVKADVAAIVAAASKVGPIEIEDPAAPGVTKILDVPAHFAKPDVQAALIEMVGRWYVTAADIERGWAVGTIPEADAHRAKHLPGFKHDPADPKVAAYHAARQNGPLPVAEIPTTG